MILILPIERTQSNNKKNIEHQLILPKFQQNGKIDFDFDSKHFWFLFLSPSAYSADDVIVDTHAHAQNEENLHTNEIGGRRNFALRVYLFIFVMLLFYVENVVWKNWPIFLCRQFVHSIYKAEKEGIIHLFSFVTRTHTHMKPQKNNIFICKPVRILYWTVS